MSIDNRLSRMVDSFFNRIMDVITILTCITGVILFTVHIIRYLY